MSLKKLLPVMCALAGLGLIVFVSLSGAADEPVKKPEPKSIPIDLSATDYVRLLGGPPQTVTMHSGLVTLMPGKSVGTHNTKNYEEVLVVLEGSGKFVVTGGPELRLEAHSMAYCPPRTEHNVTNTGETPLRYVYIVANAE